MRLITSRSLVRFLSLLKTGLAQLVERQTFNLVAVGSSPTAGAYASMPEWSKGAHLRCAVVHQRVGSNPTGCIFGSPEPYSLLTQLVRVLALCAGSREFESHTGNF